MTPRDSALAAEPAPLARGSLRHDAYANGAVIVLLLALAFLAAWGGPRIGGGVAQGDAYWFFIPMFTFLGEQLRALNIPGWNPYLLSGTPFAGDPQSGWMYFPAMVIYAFLSPVAAFTAYVVFHIFLAGLATYAFARVVGLGAAGAAVAAVAYQFTPMVEGAICCSLRSQVASWIPLALLGVELAVRSERWTWRVGGWTIAGLAISQFLAGWLGQVTYYALLTVGGYVFFRTVFSPPPTMTSPRARLLALLGHGAAVLVLGFGLGAAGLLPRLEAVALSNLAGGVYSGTAAVEAATGGWPIILALDRVFSQEDGSFRFYLAGAVMALAVIAPLVARWRSLAIYFVVSSLAAFVLTVKTTPLHDAFNLLPLFEVLHSHVPSRALISFFPGIALLAGIAVDGLIHPLRRFGILKSLLLIWLPTVFYVSLGYIFADRRRVIGDMTLFSMFGASLLIAALVVLASPAMRSWRGSGVLAGIAIPALLIGIILWDPTGSDLLASLRSRPDVPRVAPYLQEDACVGQPPGAADFLQEQGQTRLFRYFGHDPSIVGSGEEIADEYRGHALEPHVPRLLVFNMALCLHLYDIQGYNPVAPLRYIAYMTALNGTEQAYRRHNVMPRRTGSPLLDALNARYMVVPREVTFRRNSVPGSYPTVYEDESVKILERTTALDRAWIVHDARQETPEETLRLLTEEAVDPRQTVLLEVPPPLLEMPPDGATETAAVTRYLPDEMTVEVTAEAPGLLVLGEVFDPAWQASVNGVATPLLAANHALRAVPVPAGASTVELRYASPMLRLGVIVTLLTVALIAGALVAAHRWPTGVSRKERSSSRERFAPPSERGET